MEVQNEFVSHPILKKYDVQLFVKREDVLHPIISGNKFRKLKYNFEFALAQKMPAVLTYGGAFSNHILAVAAAGAESGLKTIGVIRGEELNNCWKNNPTLVQAHKLGMEFEFVSRNDYRLKETDYMKSRLQEKWGYFHEIPEGGTNKLAVKGCAEILKPEDRIFTTICCPVGTGGTLSGLAQSALKHQQILGFPALKQSQFLHEVICTFVKNTNWRLVNEYHFGGYAKINTELIDFINAFKKASGIPLDPIYTGKMMYGIIDMVKKGAIAPGTKVLAIHTGGLQGIRGMNQKLKAKGLPLIQ